MARGAPIDGGLAPLAGLGEVPVDRDVRRDRSSSQLVDERRDVISLVSAQGYCDADAVQFSWEENDEMEPASGDGWAELQDDGSIEGEICLVNGDDIPFIARRSKTSSTAC